MWHAQVPLVLPPIEPEPWLISMKEVSPNTTERQMAYDDPSVDAFQATTLLYAMRGRCGARKRWNSAISASRLQVEPLFQNLRFDYDYFGPRSFQVEESLEEALAMGMVARYLFINEQAQKKEPPHFAYIITPVGEVAARAYVTQLEGDPQHQFDFAQLATELVAQSWLPKNLALAYALSKDDGHDRPVGDSNRGFSSPAIMLDLDPSKRDLLERVVRKCAPVRLLSGSPEFNELGIKVEYSIDPKTVEKKYDYLNFNRRDVSDALRELSDVDPAFPWRPEDIMAADWAGVPLQIGERVRHSSVDRLLDDYPGIKESWKAAAERMLTQLTDESVFERAERRLKMTLQSARDVAGATEGTPVTVELRNGLGILRQEIHWAGFDTETAQRIVRDYGRQALHYFLTDPLDLISYAVVASYGLGDVAIAHTSSIRIENDG